MISLTVLPFNVDTLVPSSIPPTVVGEVVSSDNSV